MRATIYDSVMAHTPVALRLPITVAIKIEVRLQAAIDLHHHVQTSLLRSGSAISDMACVQKSGNSLHIEQDWQNGCSK